MGTFAIVVVGRDRPGVIADVTGALARHGGNLEDSSMSLLRGVFAWTLVVTFDDVDGEEVERTLAPLRRPDLSITAHPMPPSADAIPGPTTQLQLTVHGADRPGIVSELTRVIADRGGNITDLSTRLMGDLFVVVADFDLPESEDVEALGSEISAAAGRVGVTARLSPADADLL